MSIYILDGDYDYGHVVYRDECICEQFYSLKHSGIIEKWETPELKFQVFRKKIYGLPTDCIGSVFIGSYGLLLSLRATELLQPLFEGCGEFYPVRVEGIDYTWFNATAIVDNVLNDKLTIGEFWDIPNVNRLKDIQKYSFHENKVRNAPNVFRVPEAYHCRVFCNQKVADFIRNSDLLGFDIKKVWRSSDDQGEPAVEFHRPTTFRWTKEEAKAVKLKRKDMIKKLQELRRL